MATRRQVLRAMGAAAAVPAATALTGCGGSPSSGSTLNLVYLGDATQQKTFDKLFGAFARAHPKIKISARGIASKNWAEFANTVSTQIAGGKVPDIISVATEGQRLFASKGLLEPLDSYIEKDRTTVDAYFDDADPRLRKWTSEYSSPDDKTYFIPGGYNTVALYCNTEVFDKAGVDLPTDGWTWDDFKQAGLRIKKRTGAFLLPAGYSFPFVDIMPWLLSNGASTLDADWKKSTIASPAAVEAAEFVKGLVDAGLSPKPGGTFDVPTQMDKGNLATFGGGRWPTLDVRRLRMVDKVRIVPWPTGSGRGSPVGWDGWPILKASQNKDAAWTFLKWLMSKDASVFFAEIGGTNIPARNSVATGPEFRKNAPKGTEVLAEAVAYGTPIPCPRQSAEADVAVTRAWQEAITGTKSPREALRSADRKLSGLV